MHYRDAGSAGRAAIAAATAGGADGNDRRVLDAILAMLALYSRPNLPIPTREILRRAAGPGGLSGRHAERQVRRSLARLHSMGAIVRVAAPGRTPLIALPVAAATGDPMSGCEPLSTGHQCPVQTLAGGLEQPDIGTPVQPDIGSPVATPPTRAQVKSGEKDREGPTAVAEAAPPACAPASAPASASAREAAPLAGRRQNHATETGAPPPVRAALEAIAPVLEVARQPITTRQLIDRVLGPWSRHPLGVQATAQRVRLEHDADPDAMPSPLGVFFKRLAAGDWQRDRLPFPLEAAAETGAGESAGEAPPGCDRAAMAAHAQAILAARFGGSP